MAELSARFSLEQRQIRANFSLEQTTIPAIFKINAAGTTWGSISGTLSNQTDLQAALDLKADKSELDADIAEVNNRVDTVEETVSNLTDTVSDNYIELDARISDNADDILVINDTISGYGDIVTHNVNEFATAAQGALADSALQPGDNITELVNNAGYITSASLPTLEDLTTQAQLDAINSGATATNIGQITTNENDIADIRDLIPSQATTSNQLADKNFVNSSIATNTAYFIGTFNSVAELEAYSGPLTNNDYAFVVSTDAAGNTVYDRYKYNADTQQWIFEYELNNSSFTAAQWDAINSGITSGDVSLIQTALQPNDNVSELVNDAGYLQNSAEASSSLAIGDDITTNRGRYSVLLGNSTEGQSGTVALGYNASGTSSNTVAIGYNSSASGDGSTAIGSASSATANYAIQLGYGTNSTVNSLSVGFYNSYTTHYNWELLDGTTGLIPNDRISSDIARTNQIPTVNNGTLDIQVNGTSIGTFTANQANNTTANIVVPDSATWGNITGTLSNQTDLQDALDDKQDVLTAGDNITIDNNVISAKDTVYTAGTDIEIVAGSGVILPQGYQQLEYIQGNNNAQYINTGIVPTSSMNMYAKMQYVSVDASTPTQSAFLMGARDVSGQYGLFLQLTSTSIGLDWFTVNGRWSSAHTRTAGDIVEMRVNNSLAEIWLNGTSVGTHQYTPNDTTQYPLFLNALNNIGGVFTTQNVVNRIYRFTIENVADFIPAIRTSDNAIGMYDIIRNRFFTNAGTGTFIAGEVVGDELIINFTNDSGYVLSSSLATVATTGDYDDLINKPTIPTVNNGTLTIQKNGTTIGTFTANQSGNSTVNIEADTVLTDDVTVSKNSDDELQAIGVIDNNSGNAIKTWTGTRAEYDAIVTKDANTLYNITDDTDVTLSLLELLYPVGSIYIGTMATCPLATLGVGTWQLVAADRVLQGAGTRGSVGDTVNESLPNITGQINFGVRSKLHTDTSTTGAFTRSTSVSSGYTGNLSENSVPWLNFNASNVSSTYQDNAPVQQDAYLVNIWERIS